MQQKRKTQYFAEQALPRIDHKLEVFPENLAQFVDKGEDITVAFKYFYNCPEKERIDAFGGARRRTIV